MQEDNKEQEVLGGIFEALQSVKESMKDVQDSLKVLPVEIKASSQGRKPHKNEILMQYSIRELKEAIRYKKYQNRQKAQERNKRRK